MASIVVVGGGISGLSCAFRLRRAGHDVEVLERESTPGGRLKSEAHGEFTIERGAACISPRDHNLLGLVAALDLQDSVRGIAPSGDAVLRAGRFVSASWDSPVGLLRSSALSPLSRARLARLALDLARHRRLLSPLHPERAAELDGEDAASYLDRIVGRDARDRLVAPLLQASLYCDIDRVSQATAQWVLRQEAAAYRLESLGPPQTLDGGLGGIVDALTKSVRVRRGCEVVSIHTEHEGARVAFRGGGRDRLVIADAVVLAVPGPEVVGLCPKLTPAERGYFESVRFVQGLVAHLMLAEAPPAMTHYRVAFARPDAFDLYAVTAGHGRPGAAPRGAGLLSAAFRADASARLWNAEDAEIVELACENLERTPISVVRPIAAAVHRHSLLLPMFSPGSLRRLASFLRRVDRSPRLAFAGDYLVGPCAEAAVTSGMRAASEIINRIHHG